MSLALAAFLLGTLAVAVPGDILRKQASMSASQAFDSLVPAAADDELFALREIERAEDRFFALVGTDFRSRLLRQKASFGFKRAHSTPGGGIHVGAIFNLALNPDRRLSGGALQPRLLHGSQLPDFLAPAKPASVANDRLAPRSAGHAAMLVEARSNFTIEFICHLRRTTSASGANEASDAASSPVAGRIA